MSEILCSGQEPNTLVKLSGAKIDSDCEHFWGADFMWFTPFGVALAQRKRFPSDFVASSRVGEGRDRLDKEIMQFEGGFWKYLILEMDPELNGKIPWNSNDELVGKYQGKGGVSRYELESLIESLSHFHKIQTRWTTGIPDTARMVIMLNKWTCKESHSGVIPMRQPPTRAEVERMKADWRRWILGGFHGMGSGLAMAILKHDPEPLEWKDGGYWLEQVPGIGKLKAEQFRRALKPR